MISKTKLKDLAGYRLQKRCEAEDVFVAEGTKLAKEALASSAVIIALCCTEEWFEQNRSIVVQKVADENFFVVSPEELERISTLKTPNNIWMLIKRTTATGIEYSFGGLTLVLDKIQDPGNMGTIIRTADWFGIRHIVCSPDTADCFNSKVVQATMGGIFRTNVHYTDLEEYLNKCQTKNIPVYGAYLSGENIYDTPLQSRAALVIGNESKGISDRIGKYVSHKIAIPNTGGTCESLNAAVATGILCYEFCRKR